MQTCSCIEEQACDFVYDGESWDEWINEDMESDKDTKCCECDEPIKKGDKIRYIRGWWWQKDDEGCELEDESGDLIEDEDTAEEAYTCLGCAAIRDDLYGGCTIIGMLREMIGECLGFDYVTGEYDEEDEVPDAVRAKHIKEEEARALRLRRMREEREGTP